MDLLGGNTSIYLKGIVLYFFIIFERSEKLLIHTEMGTIALFISGAEIFIVILVVVLLFGAKRIPEIARGLGKGMKEFKKATDDIKREINDVDVSKDIREIKKDIENKL